MTAPLMCCSAVIVTLLAASELFIYVCIYTYIRAGHINALINALFLFFIYLIFESPSHSESECNTVERYYKVQLNMIGIKG